MDLVYIYEDKVAQDGNGNYYTGSAFSQAVFDRYLKHFDRITLLMRKAKVEPDDMETLSHMNRIESDRIDVVFLPDPRESLKSFLSPELRRRYKKIITDNITDDRAVIIRAPSDSGAIAAKYCKKIEKPYLAEAVGCPWDSLWNHSTSGKVLAPFMWLKMRHTMKNAAYAVYVTDKFLQSRYPTDGISAALSDVEILQSSDAVLEKRLEKINSKSETLKIGTAGALHVQYKGQRYVIEALSSLKNKGNTKFEYHLAGGGDNSNLKKLAENLGVSDQVFFDGVLPHDKMFGWLDGLDLYIQPSTVEAMPRALIEAMSRGLPAFASKVGDMPELLDSSDIFHKASSDEIAEMLGCVVKRDVAEMAVRNFKRAQSFEKEKLEQRRNVFYAQFAIACKEMDGV